MSDGLMTPDHRISECPYHPRPKHRECHHLGDDFVTVYWDDKMGGWLTTYGGISRRGSMTTWASREEVDYLLALMHRNAERTTL